MKKLLLFVYLSITICSANAAEIIKLIVPFAPGTTTDMIARTISVPLSQKLNLPVIVENKAGAGGDIATKFVAEADEKSIVLMLHSPSIVINTAFSTPDYDLKSFTPIANLGSVPVVYATSKKSKINNFQDLLKSNDVTYGSSGINSFTFLTGKLVSAEIKKEFVHVPYKGANQTLVDLLSGNLDSAFVYYTGALSYINDDMITPIAVTSAHRVKRLPNVPTFSELGVTGVDELDPWFVMFSNNTTRTKDLQQVKTALNKVLADAEIQSKLSELGLVGTNKQPIKPTFLFDELKKYKNFKQKYNLS